MALFGAVDIALRGDTGNLEKALGNAEKKLSKFSESVGKGGGGELFASLGSAAAVGAAAAVAAVLAVGAAIGKMTVDGMAQIDDLARTAANLGTTTEALAGLQHAGVIAGVGTEELNHSLEKFQQHISQAALGTGEAVQAFNRLGLTGEELRELPLEGAVGRVAEKLKGLSADTQIDMVKTIFGKSAVALLPLLKQGSEGIAKFTEEAKRMGLAVSGEQAAQVQEATQGWRRFQEAITGIGRSFAVIFAPVVTKVTELLNKFGGDGASSLQSNIQYFQQLALAAWDVGKAVFDLALQFSPLYQLVTSLGEALGANGASWNDLKGMALGALWGIQFYLELWANKVANAFDTVRLKLVQTGNDFKALWDNIKEGKGFSMARTETGLETTIKDKIAAREKAMEKDFQQFLANKINEFGKAPKAAEAIGKGEQLQADFLKPAAVDVLSKEAFSTVYGAQSAQEKALAAANDQLKENKKANKFLEKIAQQRFGLKPARL